MTETVAFQRGRLGHLLEKFGDVAENEDGSYTARCPLHHPDDEIWLRISKDATVGAGPKGCEAGAILEAVEPMHQVGELDGDPTPVAASWPDPIPFDRI